MDNPYYRTFIGLPFRVGEDFLDARRDLMDALTLERISWVKPERFHVTLRFLGETEMHGIQGIIEALNCEVAVPKATQVCLAQLGSFGPRKKPRVIWAGFEAVSLFALLKKDVDRALKLCGYSSMDQAFTPHLTLGRIRSLKNLSDFYQTLETMKNRFTESIIFDRLVFYRSILGPAGPEYQVLKELRFPG